MKYIKKLVVHAGEELDYGHYVTPIIMLQDQKVMEFIHDFIYTEDSKLDKESISAAKDIICISKALYDANQYRVIKFKTLPDDIYDDLLEKYKVVTQSEPFQKVIPAGMRSISHDFPELVGTLDKAYSIYDISKKMSVERYLRKIFKKYKLETISLMISPKFDGSSMSTSYIVSNSGTCLTPVKSTSRGDFDSDKGVDMGYMTSDRPSIEVPKDTFGQDGDIVGIQYEIMVNEHGRNKLTKLTKIDYATRRAASAAVIKRILNDSTSHSERTKLNGCVSLVPVNVCESLLFKRNLTWSSFMLSTINSTMYGDITNKCMLVSGDIDKVLESLQTMAELFSNERMLMSYSIDGLVISVIDEDIRKDLGRLNNKNQWQIAYKFGAMVQRTHIADNIIENGETIKTNGIISTHGKMGFIGHNITFEPIEFNGVRYDKAPVNNITRFDALDPHIGDEVLISYNADVMGYIYKDDTCIPNKNGKRVKLPTVCDECGKPLEIQRDMLICTTEDCIGNAVGKILDIIGILDIDFFGYAIANDLAHNGITNAAKFIQMDKDTLAKVLKGKNLDKCYEEFRTKIAAEIDYSKVFDMLRIPSLGSRMSKKIIKTLGVKEILRNINNKDEEQFANILRTVPGIDTNGINFAKGLISKRDELYGYLKLLNVMDTEFKIYDKTILVSGFRKNKDVEEICYKRNWNLVDSGPYDILIVTQDRINGAKANKAREKNKPIYTLPEFIEIFK